MKYFEMTVNQLNAVQFNDWMPISFFNPSTTKRSIKNTPVVSAPKSSEEITVQKKWMKISEQVAADYWGAAPFFNFKF